MSSEDDRAFYERRLREERARAASAGDEPLRHLHLQWAALYEARLAEAVIPNESGAPAG